MKTKKIIQKYCIEVYKVYNDPITYQSLCNNIECLKDMLAYTEQDKDLKTIAIFKIKLK